MGSFLRRSRFVFGCLILAPVLFAQAPPDAAEQAKIITAMREASVVYDKNLPNFICSQTTHREIRLEPDLQVGVRTSGRGGVPGLQSQRSGQWDKVDSYEETLSYFDHHETYQLVKMNGKPAGKNKQPPPGLASTGEFGSTLLHIFEKESKTEFEWRRWDTLRGHAVHVFYFHIDKENSVAQLTAGTQQLVVAYHGFLFTDRDTNTVLRVTTEAEIPPDFPLQNVKHVLDYGQAKIAGESFLLPLHSEMETTAGEDYMRTGRMTMNSKQATMRNTVDFDGYRKYSTESTLKPD